MKKRRILVTTLACLLLNTSSYAANVYSEWHSHIGSITPLDGNLYIYIDGDVEANPANCSDGSVSGNGYVLTKINSGGADTAGFAETYSAILGAFFSGNEVRFVVTDNPNDCGPSGKPRVRWLNVR